MSIRTTKTNDIRVQFIADSRILAALEIHFTQIGVPINSVSDLVRKSLQSFAFSVLDPSLIPSKQEAQHILSSLAQHGRGFAQDYSTPGSTSSLTTRINEDSTISQFLAIHPEFDKEGAREILNKVRNMK